MQEMKKDRKTPVGSKVPHSLKVNIWQWEGCKLASYHKKKWITDSAFNSSYPPMNRKWFFTSPHEVRATKSTVGDVHVNEPGGCKVSNMGLILFLWWIGAREMCKRENKLRDMEKYHPLFIQLFETLKRIYFCQCGSRNNHKWVLPV